jgi:hypothetical protein
MPLPASGAISLNDIQATMGGSNPIGLDEYYRGGANVPNITQNNAIPTSGQISLSNFYNTYGRLSTSHTITIGSQTYTVSKTNYTDYGYRTTDVSYGSLSPTTFSNSLGTTTIKNIYWEDFDDELFFTLNRDTNTDLNFYEIVVGSTTFTRSSATFTDLGTDGQWKWIGVGNPVGTSGTQTLTVRTYA